MRFGSTLGAAVLLMHGLLQEGLEKGRRLLVRQLRRRFGDLPVSVLARIECADEASLERWSEELLDAPSLAALFPAA